MYVLNKGLEISLSENDISSFESLLYSAKQGIEQSIKDHYNSKHHDSYGRGVSHARDLLLEQTGAEIAMLSELMARFGKKNVREDLIKFLEDDYKKQHGGN